MLTASVLLLSLVGTAAGEMPLMSVWSDEAYCPTPMISMPQAEVPRPAARCSAEDGQRDPRCSADVPVGVPSSRGGFDTNRIDYASTFTPVDAVVHSDATGFLLDDGAPLDGVSRRIERPPRR